MNNRIWIFGTAVASVAILLIGGLLFIKPKIDEIIASTSEVVNTTMTNEQYAADLASLKLQYENLDDVKAELDSLRLSLPSGAEHAQLARQVAKAAADAGLVVGKYTTDVPVVYGATDVSGAAPSAADPGSISGGMLVAMPVGISIRATDPNLVFQFMDNLRKNSRLVLIYDWTMNPDTTDGVASYYDFDIKVYAYSLVDPNEPLPDPNAAPEQPAPTPTPTETPAVTDPDATDPEAPVTP